MPWNWSECVNKSMDWTFNKAGGFGKYNGWGSASAAAGVGMVAVPACVVGGFFTDSSK